MSGLLFVFVNFVWKESNLFYARKYITEME